MEEARKTIPEGMPRSGSYLNPQPIYAEKAKGGKLIDVDGNEYIDVLLCGSTVILGHSAETPI